MGWNSIKMCGGFRIKGRFVTSVTSKTGDPYSVLHMESEWVLPVLLVTPVTNTQSQRKINEMTTQKEQKKWRQISKNWTNSPKNWTKRLKELH